MPNGSTRRSMEGPLILNIPPYASHDVRDDENPTLHWPEVVEPPDIFQRPSGQGVHPKTLPQYSTRTMAEELGYAAEGESHHMEVKMNFHLPLPRQPHLTDVHAWRAPILTKQGNKAIYIQIDEWVNMYGTNIFVVDEITGRMYAEVGDKLHSILEIASHWHQEEPALTPRTNEQDQTSARQWAPGEEQVWQAPTLGERTGTISPWIAETSPSVASGPQGTAHKGIDARGAATERRDRDSQIIGIIRPVASQPPMPHDVEEVQEPNIEFDWENKTIEQWAYARQDTMTRELFQAPRTGTPQHWKDLHYCQARCAWQRVLDLQNTRQEVESQLLTHHLHVQNQKPKWFSPRVGMRRSNVDIWSSPGDRSRAFPGLSVSHPTWRHRWVRHPCREVRSSSITDPKPSGLKRNTSGCDLNYEDTGMPLRPGMIYSISSYIVYHEQWSLITRIWVGL